MAAADAGKMSAGGSRYIAGGSVSDRLSDLSQREGHIWGAFRLTVEMGAPRRIMLHGVACLNVASAGMPYW